MDNQAPQQTSILTPAPKNNSLYIVFRYVVIGTGILGIGFLIAIGGFLLLQNNTKKLKDSETVKDQVLKPSITPFVKDLSSTKTNTDLPNQKLYTNPKLGISFKFSDKTTGKPVDVKETGNRIYVYFTKYPYTQGQYVEVFDKNPSETLDQAIKNQFLTNISLNDCFIKTGIADKEAKFPSNFEVKTLGFPTDLNSDIPAFAQANKCPVPYAETNGISYFLGDTMHPGKFFFFSIGQFGLSADTTNTISWQDTVKFLD
jgi:hypothetical protein